MDLKSMFVIRENKDAKRWEFQPTGDWIGYTVSFNDADNESDAWISIFKSIEAEIKRKINKNL